jgi:hypothetical protein
MSVSVKKRTATPEEEEFLLAENRHEEVLASLSDLSKAILQKEDKGISDAINGLVDKQDRSMEKVAKAIESIPKPEVNVEVNQTELLSLLKEIKEEQKDIKKEQQAISEAFQNRPMVDEFIISAYGYNGQDRKAKVVYTPANKINFKK